LPYLLSLQAFDVVERSFLESIDDALAEKASLQSQLPEVISLPALEEDIKAWLCWEPESLAVSLATLDAAVPREQESWEPFLIGRWGGDGFLSGPLGPLWTAFL
jgi:hypothetical protein